VTFVNRLKLFGGLLAVVALVGVFTLVFNHRQNEVQSTSASITADSYIVGTDYGGTVTKQYVHTGDRVKPGEKLFKVRSLSLLQELNRNPVSFSTATYSVRKDGTMTFKATVAGTVGKVGTKQDDYVQPGEDLATIYKANSLYAVADYSLTPRDYERLGNGAAVDLVLPNRQVLHGTVQDISVRTANGQAQIQAKVASDRLVEGGDNGLITPGAPLATTVHLRQDGVLNAAQDATFDFLRRIGL
jgi:multidrug resistance efflux pump